MNPDDVAKAMLGMAEALRTQDPPKLKMAIKCARSCLKLELSEEMVAVCNYQLGKLLFYYTDNYELARGHLMIAHEKMSIMGAYHNEDKMHAMSMLADLHIHYQAWPLAQIRNAVRNEIATNPGQRLTCKLMFQLIELCKIDGDTKSAFDICDHGINLFQHDIKMQLYFRITKTLVHYQLIHEEPENPSNVAQIGAMIMALEGMPHEKVNLECIKDFYVCTKLSFMFYQGQSRTARPLLRQIQKSQMDDTPTQGIRWLGETSMTVFACMLNIVGALVQSNSDRVEKYHNLLMKHADEILFKAARTPSEPGVVRCISMIKMSTLEIMACCNVMVCRPEKALTNINDMLEVSAKSSGSLIWRYFAPHIQYLLGLQCSYFRQDEAAERHFLMAIKTFQGNRCNPANTLALLQMNLAMTYLNQLKMPSYLEVAELLVPTKTSQCSSMLKNNLKFIIAFYSYLNNKISECRASIHDVLYESKAEDFFRLHGLALLLTSCMIAVDEKSIKPTCDWSKKAHDHALTVWSHRLKENILTMSEKDHTKEILELQEDRRVSELALQVETMIPLIQNLPAAKLLEWYEGDPLKLVPRDEAVI